MISSSRQLKDKVRNISDGNSNKATTLIRNFMMERFLERVSISSYRDNFILKGGMLVASIVGVDMRATMDIDTTVKALPLNEADVQRIIEEICNIPLDAWRGRRRTGGPAGSWPWQAPWRPSCGGLPCRACSSPYSLRRSPGCREL